MATWGAPAISPAPVKGVADTQSHFRNISPNQYGRSPAPYHNQRPSPYHDNRRGRGGTMNNTFQNNRNQNNGQHLQFSKNPYHSQRHGFSSDNPFQSNGQNFSPNNPFQAKGHIRSPNHSPIRANLPTSPLAHSQALLNSSFSPRTPNMRNSTFSPRTPDGFFQTPSPRGFHRRNVSQNNHRMSNPGGSDNIRAYIHPSMLEDPWKNLTPTLMQQPY